MLRILHSLKGLFSGAGFSREDLDIGLSQVPFKWQYFGDTFEMIFVAGMIGTEQTPELALRPHVAWMIADNPK